MPLQFRFCSCAMSVVLLFSLAVGLVMAGGPAEYTVTRSFSEQSLCDEVSGPSTSAELTGAGDGNPGDMLTVTETLSPGG